MNISIWDLDWFEGISKMPNVECMKLSSFHKQKGDAVHLVTTKEEIGLQFDKLYIARISEKTTMPSSKILNDKRVMLLGKGFQYYGAKTINAVVASCRPDYLLYNIEERNPYANANFVQFYCGKQLLKQKQDWHNTFKYHKKTIVVDSYFWKAEEPQIISCLEELKDEKNIAFLEPIWLEKIKDSTVVREKFFALNFSIGTTFKWKNTLPFSAFSVNWIIEFLSQLRTKTKSDLGSIPFSVELANTEEDEIVLANCFQVIDAFKTNKFCCHFKFNGGSRFKFVANQIEKWTERDFQLSFVNYATHLQSKIEGLSWYDIINKSEKWGRQKNDWLIYLLTSPTWENIRPYLFHMWGEKYQNELYVENDKIKEKIIPQENKENE